MEEVWKKFKIQRTKGLLWDYVYQKCREATRVIPQQYCCLNRTWTVNKPMDMLLWKLKISQSPYLYRKNKTKDQRLLRKGELFPLRDNPPKWLFYSKWSALKNIYTQTINRFNNCAYRSMQLCTYITITKKKKPWEIEMEWAKG